MTEQEDKNGLKSDSSSITVSLETAKKLKDAGRENRCIGYYEYSLYMGKSYLHFATNPSYKMSPSNLYAPTAQEILDELPIRIPLQVKGWQGVISIERNDIEEEDSYVLACYKNESLENSPSLGNSQGPNLAEALAELWMRYEKSEYNEK